MRSVLFNILPEAIIETFLNGLITYVHIRWVSYHHGMARPQVTDGGNGLQIAADILNKQSWTFDKGWTSSWGVWRGTNNYLSLDLSMYGSTTHCWILATFSAS
jgi:hypothetical protein